MNTRYIISHYLHTHLPSDVRFRVTWPYSCGLEWKIIHTDTYYRFFFDWRFFWPLLQLQPKRWRLILGTGYHTNGAVKGIDSCKDTFFHLLGFCFNICDCGFWRYKKTSERKQQ